jgi:hypothetical protein
MGFLSALGGLLSQYEGNQTATPQAADVSNHFDQVAQAAPPNTLAQGIASAIGSGGSGQFGQMVGQLFSNGSGDHQASMINTLLATAGPAVLSQFLGNNAGSAIAGLLSGGQTQVTPGQAASVPPEEVQRLAEHVHQNDSSIVDRLSGFYAQQPALVKTLGASALSMVIAHIAQQHRG